MAKYIDADKIIDYANEEVTGVFCYPQGQRKLDEDAHRDRWAFVREVMIVAPAVDVAPRWIPVTERLPKKYGKYLVSVYFNSCVGVELLWYGQINGKDAFYYGDTEWDEVIAWMPSPTPYKGGEEE